MTHLSNEQIERLKGRLTAEKMRLEEELSTIARRDPKNPSEWDPVTDEGDSDAIDKNEAADGIEDLEENAGIANTLEKQLKEVDGALARIDAGTYGTDEKTGEPIPMERLEANPSARNNI